MKGTLQEIQDPNSILLNLDLYETILNNYLLSKNECSRKDYQRTINKYLKTYKDFTTGSLQLWYSELITKGLKDKSVKKEFYILKGLFTYLKELGYLKKNPLSIYKLKRDSIVSHYQELTASQISWIYSRRAGKEPTYLLCRLQLALGLRSHEAVGLLHFKRSQDPVGNQVIEVIGKGNLKRYLIVSDRVKRMIRKLTTHHRSIFAKSLSHSDISTSAKNFRNRLKRHNKKYNVEHFTTHQLRATFATKLYSVGTPIELISRILGHQSTETTQNYITALTSCSNYSVPDTEVLYDLENIQKTAVKEHQQKVIQKRIDSAATNKSRIVTRIEVDPELGTDPVVSTPAVTLKDLYGSEYQPIEDVSNRDVSNRDV